jgi:hypothetical protein
MRIWGYWATLGWAVLAFLAGQFIAFGLLLVLHVGDWNAMLQSPFDGVLVTLFILISNPITIGVLALAVRFGHGNQTEYFALHRPQTRDVTLGIVCLVALIALCDALLYLSGRALVTPFQLQSYTTAAAEGWLLPMFSVPRLGTLGTLGMAGDRRHIAAVGHAARSVRLDRHVADFCHRPVSRLDTAAQRLDGADIRAARAVQCRRHHRDRGADAFSRQIIRH